MLCIELRTVATLNSKSPWNDSIMDEAQLNILASKDSETTQSCGLDSGQPETVLGSGQLGTGETRMEGEDTAGRAESDRGGRVCCLSPRSRLRVVYAVALYLAALGCVSTCTFFTRLLVERTDLLSPDRLCMEKPVQ